MKKTASEKPIDGRLDLHGLTLAEAHKRTQDFLASSAASGARALLIITGKGQGGAGRIRHELPHWLETASLRPLVQSIKAAPPEQGGDGAFLVSLRHPKKSAT